MDRQQKSQNPTQAWSHLEAGLQQLQGELNTSNIPYGRRTELGAALKECLTAFRQAASEKSDQSLSQLTKQAEFIDSALALEAVKQAETEIPRAEHTRAAFLALEKVRSDLQNHLLSPTRARHEVKEIMRKHS